MLLQRKKKEKVIEEFCHEEGEVLSTIFSEECDTDDETRFFYVIDTFYKILLSVCKRTTFNLISKNKKMNECNDDDDDDGGDDDDDDDDDDEF